MNNTIYKSITEVSDLLNIAPHTLRFWETKFTYLNPKKIGGSRFYSNIDILLIEKIHHYLKIQGYTIKGVLSIMRERGIENFRGGTKATPEQTQKIPEKISLYDKNIEINQPPLPMFPSSVASTNSSDIAVLKNTLTRLQQLRDSIY